MVYAVKFVAYNTIYVEAENEEDAYEKACLHEDFNYVPGTDEWAFKSISEVE